MDVLLSWNHPLGRKNRPIEGCEVVDQTATKVVAVVRRWSSISGALTSTYKLLAGKERYREWT